MKLKFQSIFYVTPTVIAKIPLDLFESVNVEEGKIIARRNNV